MDTTQKNRPSSGQSSTRQEQKARQSAPKQADSRPVSRKTPAKKSAGVKKPAAAPQSAQQKNGAARTAESQKTRAAAPQKNAAASRKQSPAERQREDSRSSRAYRRRAAERKKQNNKEKANAIASVFKQVNKKTAKADSPEAKAAQKRKQQAKAPTPAVIYTQPQQFNRSRLMIQLMTVLAVVLALVMGLSVFFKVEVITVTGAETYSAWTVREASGISEGDNLLTFSKARAGGQIKANLPYVKSVRIGIKLPDTVNIMIEEEPVVYAIKSYDGTWWLINSNGRVVEQSNSAAAAGYTQVLGVTLESPIPNEIGVATEDVPTETDEFGELIPLTVTGAQRLNAALQILVALEENDIVGDAASVDVSRLQDIVLWYGTRYQVNLGDSTRLSYKIACMNDVILQMSDYQSGILDISFTHYGSKVGYTPFE